MANIAQLLTEHMDIWTAAESEKKSGRGRASGNAGSVYGVKKLRELVLELAVRGKLVPQDPNDEPASELLKRIQAENSKLIAEGKLRKEKPIAQITDDEETFELPNGWIWVRNRELFQLRKGRIPKSLNENGLGLPYLDIDALDRNTIRRYSEELTCPQSTDKDILVVCDGSRSGLILDGKNGIIGSTLSIIDTPIFIQSYIKLIFKQGFEIFNTSMKGAAIPHLDTQRLLQNPTALPPLAEQHRIVAKVDELMALCDQLEQQHSSAQEAHEALVSQLLATLTQGQNAAEFNANWQRIYAHFDVLFTTEGSIDALKQTLLQLAVMGKLVQQDPNDEPASELLKRIQAEKAKLIAEGKLKKEKPLAPISEDEKPFELPNGWEWVRLGLVTNFGLTEKLNKITNDTWVLDLEDIEKDTSVILQKNRFSEKQSLSDKNSFKKGDVLYGKLRPYLNKVVIADEDGVCTTEILPIRCYVEFDNKYFMYAFKAPHFIEYVNARSYGMKMPRLGTDDGKNSLFPLAPLAEQHRIVAKVDSLMTLFDQLKTRIQQANQQQQAIADALVAQAVE